MASTGELVRLPARATPARSAGQVAARWSAVVPVAVSALSYFLVVVGSRWPLISDPRTETGDFAADSLQAMSAWTQTDGVHSRWGYHHPGPLLFWMENAGEHVLGPFGVNPFGAHLIAVAALATVSIAVLVVALSDHRNRRWLGPVAFLLALVSIPGDVPVLPWAPTVGNWLFLMAVAGVVAVVRGRGWGYPVAVFAACGLVHLHMLLIPFAAATLAAVALAWWCGLRPSRASALWSGVVAAVMAAPMVVDAVTGRADWAAYLATQHDPGAGFNKSALAAVGTVLEVLTPAVLAGRPMVAGLGLLFVVSLVVSCGLAARWAQAPVRVMAGGFLVSFAYLVAVSPTAYLTPESFGRVVPLLGALVVICWQASRLQPVGVAALVGLLIVAAGVMSLGVDTSAGRTFGGRGEGVAESVLQQFDAYRVAHPAAVLVIEQAKTPPETFIGAASAAVAAARAGESFCVAEDYWPGWVEQRHLCGSTPGVAFRVTFTSDTTFRVAG